MKYREVLELSAINDLRKKPGLSQKEFAGLFNVHQTAVSQWETGKSTEALYYQSTYLIIKVCYKVCYFFAQKKPACLDWQAGCFLCFDSDFRQVDIIFRQPSKFNTSLRLSICSPSIPDRLPLS